MSACWPLARSIFLAGMERVQWETICRILFDKFLPLHCRPLVTPSVN